jgi:hypothetical protein
MTPPRKASGGGGLRVLFFCILLILLLKALAWKASKPSRYPYSPPRFDRSGGRTWVVPTNPNARPARPWSDREHQADPEPEDPVEQDIHDEIQGRHDH